MDLGYAPAMTRYAKLKVETETARIAHEVKELAGVVQSFGSRGASISSGPMFCISGKVITYSSAAKPPCCFSSFIIFL